MSEWADVTIDDIKAESKSAVSIGPFGSRLKSDQYSDSGVPVIRGTNLTRGRKFSGEFVYIPESLAETMPGCNVYKGDLVFPHRGAIGEVGIVLAGRYFLSTSLMKLTVNRELVDPRWLYYFFRSPQGRTELTLNASQVGTPGIARPLNSLRAVRLSLPPLNEQERIADTLDVLNDKIELNRQTARTLEELAQCLFKSWFVDFDPVRAKIAGRQPAHMPPEVADLFPDKLVDSPIGPIPEGWQVELLSSIAEINPESYTAKNLPDSIDYIDISSVDQGWCAETTKFNKEEAPSRARRIAKLGDTVWSMVRPNRRAHFYFDSEFSASTVISTGFAVIRPRGAPTFTYFLTDHPSFSDYLERRATGAAYPAVNAKVISEYGLVWPGNRLANAFEEVAGSIKEKQASLRLESKTLEELHDRLLPKLISGELRVRDQSEKNESEIERIDQAG